MKILYSVRWSKRVLSWPRNAHAQKCKLMIEDLLFSQDEVCVFTVYRDSEYKIEEKKNEKKTYSILHSNYTTLLLLLSYRILYAFSIVQRKEKRKILRKRNGTERNGKERFHLRIAINTRFSIYLFFRMLNGSLWESTWNRFVLSIWYMNGDLEAKKVMIYFFSPFLLF